MLTVSSERLERLRRSSRICAAGGLILALGGCRADRGGHAASGSIAITHAVVPAPSGVGDASAFFVIANHGDTSVTLTATRSPVADSTLLHDMAGGQMRRVPNAVIPAHGHLLLAPGGYHLMLAGLRRPLIVGDTVTLELTLDPGGPVTIRVPVLRYTDAVSELPGR
jgi:copper(I)-binding protein